MGGGVHCGEHLRGSSALVCSSDFQHVGDHCHVPSKRSPLDSICSASLLRGSRHLRCWRRPRLQSATLEWFVILSAYFLDLKYLYYCEKSIIIVSLNNYLFLH